METWKDIPDYEGIYEVSDQGRVRTKIGKTTYTKKHGVRNWKQRYLKNKTPKGRDVRVSLWKDGKVKSWLVHRLVALAFIPKVEGKEYINHIDGNPKNNRVENLEWCNHKENNNHAFDNGLIPTKQVVLVDKKNNTPYFFRSLSKASEFLGKNKGYLSVFIKRGNYILEDYIIFAPIQTNERKEHG